MLRLDGRLINTFNCFPDNTFSFHVERRKNTTRSIIDWYYSSEKECIALYYLVKHVRDSGVDDITLFMPYCPNARMDRVCNEAEVFTLKYFTEFINSLGFTRVYIIDPHSNVAPALIDRVVVLSPKEAINSAINDINSENLILFYPDDGAAKRYGKLIRMPYGFGIKHRDWDTGKIISFEAICDTPVSGKDVLIIDDICSKGDTFKCSANALKKLGARDIYAYCTHCEETIFDTDIMQDGIIKHIYTTDSIFSYERNSMTVYKSNDLLASSIGF